MIFVLQSYEERFENDSLKSYNKCENANQFLKGNQIDKYTLK